ncbi:Sodium-coupled neutral amino acid transporter 9 [Dissostichus eleginoides]|uniref:Neutral amino acid transporter 9 n=1 Tax=Dissostichus eleginoides TaxID=100907 RepID=A0AAD9BLB3_DISEL|nr:Sodium-coupled neutral amino acid transporter 9 [Dissostichus eleginoides]
MEDDCRPLLSSEQQTAESYSQRGSTDSLDFRAKRPFYVEPRNIVGDVPQERVSAEAAILNSRVHYYSRLTASSDRLLSPPDHVIPHTEEIYIYSPLGTAFKVTGSDHSSKNPSIITIFAIWNTMMGTSILSIPWGIKQAGFTLGIIILILTGLLMLYCCYIVLKSPKAIPYVDTSDWEFPDVCRYYFGKFGQWSSLVFSMVSLVGAMVVYWVLMSNFLYNSGQFIYNYSHNVNMSDSEFGTNGSDRVICPFPNTNHEGNYTVSTVSTVFLTTSGNDTSHSTFEHWFTFLGTISVVYLISLVTIKAVRQGFHLQFHWFDYTEFYLPEFRTLFPQFTGVLTLAFFIHNCIITLMKSNKHQENNVRDLSVAYLLVGITYLYVGDCIEPNFLDNFPTSDVMVFVARGFLLFQMITVYPLLGYLVRVQVMGQIFGNHYPSFFHVLALNILIVGAGVLMAKFYPNIGSIIRFSGATCGLALVFVFPSLVHMISLKRQGLLRWPSALFHSFLILLGMANLLGQFLM